MLSDVPTALAALAKGEFVVVMDDEGRENEGDLVIAAGLVTKQKIAFMVQHTNGLLCVPMTEQRARQLDLPPMVGNNEDRNGTAFTVSCDVKEGTTTGASANDRCLTALALANANTKPTDLARPGHMFPLVAREGGVLARGGHTEASVDLLRLSHQAPVAVICELMHAHGDMMRFDDCAAFARLHALPIITVAQLVQYRLARESGPVRVVVPEDDAMHMRHAIALAEQGICSAPPNPWVGCVITKHNAVIGTGWHRFAGDLHAEQHAIANIKQREGEEKGRAQLEGSTVYVTLEPCAHQGRQPPCTRALMEHKVGRVVVCVVDPDLRVNQRGVALLREAGIQVDCGVLESAGLVSLRPYLHQRKHNRPWCVVKTALSIDGKIACADGSSQWISSAEARADVHFLRAKCQAIVVGSGTCLRDDPALTTRPDPNFLSKQQMQQVEEKRGSECLRVVLDARGRVTQGKVLEQSVLPTLICTTASAPESSRAVWARCGVEVCEVPPAEDGEGVALDAVFAELGRRGVLQVLVEGGARLHGQVLKQHANELWVYHGAKLIGASGVSWPGAAIAPTIADAHEWGLVDVVPFGTSVRCRYVRVV